MDSGRVTSDTKGNLTVSYDLTVTATSKDKIPDLTVTVTEAKGGTLVSGNYVTLPETLSITDTWGGDNGTFTKTITLTWDWGSTFGGEEPTTYFNEDEVGSAIDDKTVGSTLEAFRDAVAASSFKVTIAKAGA